MPSAADPEQPFWIEKTLEEMTGPEWESLCDGCGRCCMVKLEDEETGRIRTTDVGCTLLDGRTCRCSDYERRQERVPDCLRLTPAAVRSIGWLPPTCAYRLVGERRDLPSWHPLRTGDPDSVHRAGASVRGEVAGPEHAFTLDELLDRVID